MRSVEQPRRSHSRTAHRALAAAFRTTAAPRGPPPPLVAERRRCGSRPVVKLPPHVVPGNCGPGVGKMLRPTAIEFGALLGSEFQLGIALLLGQTLPESHRKLGAFARRKFQEFSKVS